MRLPFHVAHGYVCSRWHTRGLGGCQAWHQRGMDHRKHPCRRPENRIGKPTLTVRPDWSCFAKASERGQETPKTADLVRCPARSLGDGGGDVPPVEVVARRLGLNRRPDRPSGHWPPLNEVSPWALPFAIDITLGRDEEDLYRWGPFSLEEHLFAPRRRREAMGPSAFAQYVAYAPVVPFESSPLTPKSLSELAAAGGSIGGALGAYVTGDPLLLLTIPAGIIVCGAARGVSQALEIDLRSKVLELMGVRDPYAAKDEPPPATPPSE
jgi:hypothetical protein